MYPRPITKFILLSHHYLDYNVNGFSFEMNESFAGFIEIIIQAGINIWAEIRMKSLNRFFPIGRIMASEKSVKVFFRIVCVHSHTLNVCASIPLLLIPFPFPSHFAFNVLISSTCSRRLPCSRSPTLFCISFQTALLLNIIIDFITKTPKRK